MENLQVKRSFSALDAFAILILFPALVFGAEAGKLKTDFSGYVKSLNFLTRTSGLTPEFVDRPTALSKENSNVFNSLERLRLQTKSSLALTEKERLTLKVDYDHQPYFGLTW